MTVHVEKPSFNLRDKLTQLDYATLPYEKIPRGGIVQYKYNSFTNHSYTTSAQAWSSITGCWIEICPKFHDSIITFKTSFSYNLNDNDGYIRFRVVDYNRPSGTSTVLHSNTYCGAADYYIDGNETNGWYEAVISTAGRLGLHGGTLPHNGRRKMKLWLQVWVYNGGTLSLNWSGSDNRIVEAMEVRA